MTTNTSTRQRCLTVGCNPRLGDVEAASEHRIATGHRTAAWPVRSAEGIRRAKVRNRTGYYDKYNVGAKSAGVRFGVLDREDRHDFGDAPGDDEEIAFGEDDF